MFAFMLWTVYLFRSDMLFFLTWFGHVPVKESFQLLFSLTFVLLYTDKGSSDFVGGFEIYCEA